MNNKQEISFSSKVLDLNFAYTDSIVDCDTAKRFLPILADQDLSINIPTPITVHLEHCPECQKDLKTLVNFDLRKDQLYVLSQIFTELSCNTTKYCDDIETDISFFAKMEFSLISQDVLKQICLSKTHRQKVFSIRSVMLDKIEKRDKPGCDISYNSLFDICFPYSRKPMDFPGQSETDLLHIKSCHLCLSNAQELFGKLGKICDRKNSGITTRLSLKKDIEIESFASDDYKDWPVEVEVFNEKPENIRPSNPNTTNKNIKFKKYFARNTKPISIAAGFLLIFGILFNINSASAISLREVIIALENVKSLCLTSNDQNGEFIQTTLMSRPRNILILDSEKQTVLFDLNSNIRTIRSNITHEKQILEITPEIKKRVNDNLDANWGIIPKEVTNSSWENITKKIEQVPAYFEVYELQYKDAKNDGVKWTDRVWIDVRTKLPHKIKVYLQLNPDSQAKLTNIFHFEYEQAEHKINSFIEELK